MHVIGFLILALAAFAGFMEYMTGGLNLAEISLYFGLANIGVLMVVAHYAYMTSRYCKDIGEKAISLAQPDSEKKSPHSEFDLGKGPGWKQVKHLGDKKGGKDDDPYAGG